MFAESLNLDSDSGYSPDRPTIGRVSTEKLLSYYEKAGSDGIYSMEDKESTDQHVRPRLEQVSANASPSTSFSEYSSDSSVDDPPSPARHHAQDSSIQKVKRRPSIPNEKGGDRRRIAIVQMDPVSESNARLEAAPDSAGASGSRSCRAQDASLGGIALVAPPDASLANYSTISAPSPNSEGFTPDTVPLQEKTNTHPRPSPTSAEAHAPPSLRKTGSLKRKPSRNVGIVGTLRATYEAQQSQPPTTTKAPASDQPCGSVESPSLQQGPPLFVTPQIRTPIPSPGDTSDRAEPYTSSRAGTFENGASLNFRKQLGENLPIFTPAIGQEKGIDVPVAPPVITALNASEVQQLPTAVSSGNAQEATGASGYLHYQPGVHSTAGPLPPPPRAAALVNSKTPAPPRPPRLQSPPPSRHGRDPSSASTLAFSSPVTAVLDGVISSLTTQAASSMNPTLTTGNGTSVSPNPRNESPIKRNNSSVENFNGLNSTDPILHIREGAFPPSTIMNSTALSHEAEAIDELKKERILKKVPRRTISKSPSIVDLLTDVGEDVGLHEVEVDPSLPTVVEPPHEQPVRPTAELKRDASWVSLHFEDSPRSSFEDRLSSDSATRSPMHSPPASEHSRSPSRGTPSPPPKSFKNTFNLKRFTSLPRTPSVKSSSRASYISRTPSNSSVIIPASPIQSFSALSPPSPQHPPLRKIRSRAPAAMFFSEILSNRSTLERCIGYAQKINELYNHDCGLGDWVINTKYGDASKPRSRIIGAESPVSGYSFTPQPRHTSRSSVLSDATFPMRPDASVATDLTLREGESKISVMPNLPYPSLVPPPRSSSMHSHASQSQHSHLSPQLMGPPAALPAHITGKSGGFFSSLGRKSSVSRSRSGGAPGNVGISLSVGLPVNKLLKPPPALPPRPSPTSPTQVAPSIPGGPRAPSSRMQRSQTLMLTKPFASDSPRSPDAIARRPSFHGDSVVGQRSPVYTDPEFLNQVDRLADLLPHAEKDVLAGYLRRSGQDILAIGQYLEDQRWGRIRRD